MSVPLYRYMPGASRITLFVGHTCQNWGDQRVGLFPIVTSGREGFDFGKSLCVFFIAYTFFFRVYFSLAPHHQGFRSLLIGALGPDIQVCRMYAERCCCSCVLLFCCCCCCCCLLLLFVIVYLQPGVFFIQYDIQAAVRLVNLFFISRAKNKK